MTKQEEYNGILERLKQADIYFQGAYAEDTEENKDKAVQAYCKLIRKAEKLYAELKPSHAIPELNFGFGDNRMSLKVDLELEMANILERLDIIRSDNWIVESMEYRKAEKCLMIGFKRT